jgi:hypothetical protein
VATRGKWAGAENGSDKASLAATWRRSVLRNGRPSRVQGEARSLPPSTTSRAQLGARSWGQVRGFRGGSTSLRGKRETRGETSRIAGKALNQARFRDQVTAMVRRGSTVRVRQRACRKALQMGILCCLRWRRFGLLAGTRRVHFGTGGHSGARTTPRDTSVTYSIAATHSTSPCKQTRRVSCAGTKRIPSFG